MAETPEIVHLTADEAVATLTAAAFEITDPEASDYGRKIVHCFMGPFGADWSLEGAVTLVRRADDIAWLPNLFGHELAVLADGKVHKFDAKRPGGAS